MEFSVARPRGEEVSEDKDKGPGVGSMSFDTDGQSIESVLPPILCIDDQQIPVSPSALLEGSGVMLAPLAYSINPRVMWSQGVEANDSILLEQASLRGLSGSSYESLDTIRNKASDPTQTAAAPRRNADGTLPSNSDSPTKRKRQPAKPLVRVASGRVRKRSQKAGPQQAKKEEDVSPDPFWPQLDIDDDDDRTTKLTPASQSRKRSKRKRLSFCATAPGCMVCGDTLEFKELMLSLCERCLGLEY